MRSTTRLLLAAGAVSAAGLALPLTLALGQRAEGGPAHDQAAPKRARPAAPTVTALRQRAPAVSHVRLDEMIIAAAPAPPRAVSSAFAAERAPKQRRCTRRRAQTFDAGPLRICDVPRSSNGMRARLFSPLAKRRRLSPRDSPSPTGLLREQESAHADQPGVDDS